MSSKFISCKINGKQAELKVYRKSKFSTSRGFARRGECVWPWRFMQAGDCVAIPYTLANYRQIQNAINGYVKHASGAKFSYRSEIDCLEVLCVSAKEKASKE